MSNHHPTRRLTAPDGSRPYIDAMLAPLIKTLWKLGYDTITCCQDVGESLAKYPRKSAYYKGYAEIDMPVEDACHLIDTIKDTPQFADRMHWANPGGWDMTCQIIPGWEDEETYLYPGASILFPNDQIDELIKVLTDR